MKCVDYGHEIMVMVIIFSTLGVKIRTCGHKICTFLAHFTLYGMIFASCVLVFSRILLPIHKKICTWGGGGPSASPSHPQHHVCLASPRAVGLSSSPMLTLFANGQSGSICYSVYGQHRGLLAARHTCGKQQRWAVSMELRCTSTMIFHGNAPVGAVYTALRPAFRQVQQVGCLLELLLELSAVPVWWYIFRRACTCMRQDCNLPVAPVME